VPGPPPGDLAPPPAPPGKDKDADGKDKPAAAASGAGAGAGEKTFVGFCLCKLVKVQATGLPSFSGFCHCTSTIAHTTRTATLCTAQHSANRVSPPLPCPPPVRVSVCSKHGGTDRGLVAGWPTGKVVVLDGKEHVSTYKSSDRLTRSFCKACGTGLISESPAHTGLSPAVFSDGDTWRVPKELAPTVHIHYGSSCLLGAIKDGSTLPLFKDTPKPMGGSGDIIKE
jgi:hypothetical protein